MWSAVLRFNQSALRTLLAVRCATTAARVPSASTVRTFSRPALLTSPARFAAAATMTSAQASAPLPSAASISCLQ